MADRTFTLNGAQLDTFPDTIVGYMSSDNDDPMQGYNSSSADALKAVLVSKSENEIVLSNGYHSKAQSLYLGVVINATNGQILWVNTTRPLP